MKTAASTTRPLSSPSRSERASAPAMAFLVAILLAACGGKGENPLTPSPPPASGGDVYYTALGASDAAGIGSSAPCIPFTDCPSGMGYVPVIARRLKAAGSTVTLSNLGIPGAMIGPGFLQLANEYGGGFPTIPGYELKGSLTEGEVPYVPRNSTIVTIFAGGNDVRTVARALDKGAGGSNPQAFLDQQIANFRNDYNTVISRIKERAPQARIVAANLPNFAGLPYAGGYSSTQRLWLQKISLGFSTQVVNNLTTQGVLVVDLLCNGQFNSSSMFSSDGFHPNDAGYAALADAMLAAIQAASHPAPSASCAQMTLIR
jgi:lysophospholipase L1-like esterase